jgi:hypothetical protein
VGFTLKTRYGKAIMAVIFVALQSTPFPPISIRVLPGSCAGAVALSNDEDIFTVWTMLRPPNVKKMLSYDKKSDPKTLTGSPPVEETIVGDIFDTEIGRK